MAVYSIPQSNGKVTRLHISFRHLRVASYVRSVRAPNQPQRLRARDPRVFYAQCGQTRVGVRYRGETRTAFVK